jgi:methionyl-tRNA synthetase
MSDINEIKEACRIDEDLKESRPIFPKRAVITGGMPYGNKELHFGHVGAVFVHADTYARFLRDRIGKENVIFVSGTDCYGSPILEYYRKLVSDGLFQGTIEQFVELNHKKQKEILEAYDISLNLFAASGIGRAAEIHREVSNDFIQSLYEKGLLKKMTTSQFYDSELGVFLNGRQVVGQCPIAGCRSDKGYADECSLGHQYMPANLINPKSTLSGNRPEMKDITNWYFKLEDYHKLLAEWADDLKDTPSYRRFVEKSIKEFLEAPVVYIKKDQLEEVDNLKTKLPEFILNNEENKPSFSLAFKTLEARENACLVLTENSIRFRTGKTLVPFRLTGNIKWGVPAPDLEDLEALTIWVWPESLWAPISFTRAYLEMQKDANASWRDWWFSEDSKVYQFIGEDNVYFYGPAEMAMFMGYQGIKAEDSLSQSKINLPNLVVNSHILFLDKKASSSSEIKPPMAAELLSYYTPEQLRAHFLGLGLSIRSVSFQPKPLNPKANEKDSDPVLKEGNLLSNVFNRAVRSCFYTAQKYSEGKIPVGEINSEVLEESKKTIIEFERLMSKCEFHQVMNLMDTYLRNINKYWSKNIREADEADDNNGRLQVLVDAFHMVRTATVLMHPIAPKGTEMILEYLNINNEFWDWNRIFDSIYTFMDKPLEHKLKFLEPRVDFFEKHESQIKQFDQAAKE